MNKMRDKKGKYIKGHPPTSGAFKKGHPSYVNKESIEKTKKTWLSRRIRVHCDFCGKNILITPFNYKNYKKHYCNKICQIKDRKGKIISFKSLFKKGHPPTFQAFGKNNPNWKGGKEHQKKVRREYRKKREYEDPKFRLDRRFSKAIYVSLKGSKQFRKWEELVGYTVEELKIHLEKQFDKNMSWSNYGSYWEIDHIKPRFLFSYSKPEDNDFKKCWSLDNLRPLQKNINRRNGVLVFNLIKKGKLDVEMINKVIKNL